MFARIAKDSNHYDPAYIEKLDAYFLCAKLPVTIGDATRFYAAIANITDTLHRQQCPPLNLENHHIAATHCEQLAEVCKIIGLSMSWLSLRANDIDVLFAEIVDMTREQLSAKYGFFNPPINGEPIFLREKQLWTLLVAHTAALRHFAKEGEVIVCNILKAKVEENEKCALNLHDIALLRNVAHRCNLFACVIERHLLVHTIAHNATSASGTPVECFDGMYVCDSCNGTAESHAECVIATLSKNFEVAHVIATVEKMITDVWFVPMHHKPA